MVNQEKKFKCGFCKGEFTLSIIKDPRNYKPYFYSCPFCKQDVDSRLH